MCVVSKMARKRKLSVEERKNAKKCKSFLFFNRKIANRKTENIFFMITKCSETGGNSDRKRSGRPRVKTESEDKFSSA